MTSHIPYNISVFGAGSIGCYLGGQLAAAGHSVDFIGRARFKSALESHGLTLTHYARETVTLAPTAFTFSLTPASLRTADVVLVCVKSQDTETAAKTLAASVRPETIIISFQNGVGNDDTLRAHLPNNTVLAAIVPFNVTGTSAGHFHCGTEGDLSIQDHSPDTLTHLVNSFAVTGQVLRPVTDIRAVQWGKLLVNLNNALNALTGGPLKAGLMQRDYRTALALLVQEGLDVVRGTGLDPAPFGKASPEKMIKILRLPNWMYRIIMNRVVKIDAAARSSMLDDLEAGRSPEIQYLQGAIVDLAHKSGQAAPYNARIQSAVYQAFDAGVSPRLNGSEILELLHTQE